MLKWMLLQLWCQQWESLTKLLKNKKLLLFSLEKKMTGNISMLILLVKSSKSIFIESKIKLYEIIMVSKDVNLLFWNNSMKEEMISMKNGPGVK